jgi:tRNA A37 methylthiotransferase MiaB
LDTLNILKDLQFNQVLVYPYSDRPSAESYKMIPKVSKEVIADRIHRIKCLKIGTNFIFHRIKEFLNENSPETNTFCI